MSELIVDISQVGLPVTFDIKKKAFDRHKCIRRTAYVWWLYITFMFPKRTGVWWHLHLSFTCAFNKKTQILDVCRWYHMHSVSRCVIAFFALAVAGAAREQVPRGSTIRPVASIKVYEGEDDGWRESVKTFYSLTLWFYLSGLFCVVLIIWLRRATSPIFRCVIIRIVWWRDISGCFFIIKDLNIISYSIIQFTHETL